MSGVKIPPSSATVSVSVIDSTASAYNIPAQNLFKPTIPGLDTLNFCSYAFLVTNENNGSKRSLVFDLGIRKDWRNLVPSMVEKLDSWKSEVLVEKDVADILVENGTDLGSIEAIIWRFPKQVKLVVGPGIIEKYMPGWPTVPKAEFHLADVEYGTRPVVELSKDMFTLDVGGLRAYDYFEDGSFYVLDAPGHSIGHLNALARTSSNPDTFIFMAADSVHLGGEFRPSDKLPLPNTVEVPGLQPHPCPVEVLLALHPRNSVTLPYLGLDPCFPENLKEAENTILALQEFDADNRVFVIFAHDVTIFRTLEYYPKSANEWQKKGWKAQGRWAFLADIQRTIMKGTARF